MRQAQARGDATIQWAKSGGNAEKGHASKVYTSPSVTCAWRSVARCNSAIVPDAQCCPEKAKQVVRESCQDMPKRTSMASAHSAFVTPAQAHYCPG